MSKLGYESKAHLQRILFTQLVSSYFKDGNAEGRSTDIASDINGIVRGLSLAWDSAEEDAQ